MSTDLMTDATAKTDAEILALALKRFRHSHDAEAVLRGHILADKKFAAGEHWDSKADCAESAEGADGRESAAGAMIGRLACWFGLHSTRGPLRVSGAFRSCDRCGQWLG